MSDFGRVLRVIHRRALWQALLVYLGVSYAVLEAVDLFIDRFGMPSWLFPLAFALLLAGLPVILVTTFMQTSGEAARRSDPTLLPDAIGVEPAGATAGGPGTSQRVRRLFSWRNALLGGVAAFALWGVVTAGWLLTGFPGLFLVKAEAEFFNARDRVVVANFTVTQRSSWVAGSGSRWLRIWRS